MIENNNYGSLSDPNVEPKFQQRQSFEITEPRYPKNERSCCHKAGETDGFKIIVISMFVFAVGVTVALIITIASGIQKLIFIDLKYM